MAGMARRKDGLHDGSPPERKNGPRIARGPFSRPVLTSAVRSRSCVERLHIRRAGLRGHADRLELFGDVDLGRILHVGGHEGLRAGDAVGIAVEGRVHAGIFRIHHEVLEELGILDILGVLENDEIVGPVDIAFLGVAELDLGVGQTLAEGGAVPVAGGHDVARAHLLDGAVFHRHPVGLGLQQRVAHLLEHFAVARALLAAIVEHGGVDDVDHFGHDVDLALQRVRRVEDDAPGVDVAVIGCGVDDHADNAMAHGTEYLRPGSKSGLAHSGAMFLAFSILPGSVSSSRPRKSRSAYSSARARPCRSPSRPGAPSKAPYRSNRSR